jgi:hypothetical protein
MSSRLNTSPTFVTVPYEYMCLETRIKPYM